MPEKAAEGTFELSYRVGAATLRTVGQKIPFDQGPEGISLAMLTMPGV